MATIRIFEEAVRWQGIPVSCKPYIQTHEENHHSQAVKGNETNGKIRPLMSKHIWAAIDTFLVQYYLKDLLPTWGSVLFKEFNSGCGKE